VGCAEAEGVALGDEVGCVEGEAGGEGEGDAVNGRD